MPPVGEPSAALAVLEGIEPVIVMPSMLEAMLDISISTLIDFAVRERRQLGRKRLWTAGKARVKVQAR
jgi:hypothetical protein